jgi:hypothetical protein
MNDVTPEPQPLLTPANVIRQYIALRRKVEAITEAANKEAKPFDEAMKVLGNWLMAYLAEAGLNNCRTDWGTAYTATRTQAKVSDRDKFIDFVMSGNWEMANLTADRGQVETWLEEHNGDLPPGVEVNRIKVVQVRAP